MTTDTLIDGNTPNTVAAQSADSTTQDATTAVDTASTTAATEQQATAAQTTDATETKGADGTDTTAAEKPTAPEKYEFKPVEGAEIDPAIMGEFEGVAKEAGLTQEAGQKVLDKMGPKIAAAQQAQVDAVKAQWIDSARTDKEFGGDKLNENLAVAKKAMDAFGTPALRTLLNDTGLGNHPEIIRAFYRAGQKISGSNFVAGGGNSDARGTAATLYPNQSKG